MSVLLLAALIAQFEQPITVALDAQQISAAPYTKLGMIDLERQLLARLVQEGFAVVSLKREPALVVQLSLEPGALVVQVRERRRRVALGPALAALHLEVVQRAAQLLRAALDDASLEVSEPGAPRLSTSTTVARSATPAPAITRGPSAPWRLDEGFELGAGLGALARDQGVDLQVRLLGRYGLGTRIGRGGLGLRLDMGLAPPLRSDFQVLEWQTQAGVDLRVWLSDSWSLEVGALLGVVVHRFSSALTEPGVRVDALGSFPVALGCGLGETTELRLLLLPGLSEERREHLIDGAVVWSRGALRLTVGLLLAWRP